MTDCPTEAEIVALFANSDPDQVWIKVSDIVARINPSYDNHIVHKAFIDVVSLFRGEYPGYCSIKTLYHDMPHTLDVMMCAVRLMDGLRLSGMRFSDDEISLILIAVLMHDIGYAQLEGEESGTGAQYTQTHVTRGITFMENYLWKRKLSAGFAIQLKYMMSATDPALIVSDIQFPNDRTRLLGQIVVMADLTGQMADRSYLEKLLFLYLEFKEAHFGNFQSIHEMLRQTKKFYEITREKLDGSFGGIYIHLALHFKDVFGTEENFYLDSIEKNIRYLEKVIEHNEVEHLTMLKRGGIVDKFNAIATRN
jgi:hypothetical protein